jgi:hypothetical protein
MELLNVHEAELKSCSVMNQDADTSIGSGADDTSIGSAMKPKLRRLDRINKILAHRPWMIKKHHIKVN